MGGFLFFMSVFTSQVAGQNEFYVFSTELGAFDPGVIYRVNHRDCELIKVVELNLFEHVPQKSSWADIAFDPDGNLYFIEGAGRVFLIDTITGDLEFIFRFENSSPPQYMPGLVIDHKGIFYGLRRSTGEIQVYNPETGEQHRSPSLLGDWAGYDLTFYNGLISFQTVGDYPRKLYATSKEHLDTLVEIANISNYAFGGVSTYADSCESRYILGASLYVWNGVTRLNSFYEIYPEKDSSAAFCDGLFSNPNLGMGGAAHRYEYRASMPPIQFVDAGHELAFPDPCDPITATLTVRATGGIDEILYALNDNNFTKDSDFLLEEPGW